MSLTLVYQSYRQELLVTLRDLSGKEYYILYDAFWVGEAPNFSLGLGRAVRATVYDAMLWLNGSHFSAVDKDNDDNKVRHSTCVHSALVRKS